MKSYPTNYQLSTEINRLYSTDRKIPIGIQLKIWFGNVLTIIGLAFVLMGLPFSILFFPFSSIFAPSFDENDPVTSAIITESTPTNSSINKVTVYKYTYTYQINGKGNFNGYGYSTGNLYDVNTEISIYYKADKPELSKAKDLRTSEFGGELTFFVLVFPLIGLVMLFFSIRKAIKQIYILKIGELAEGKLLFKNPTNTKINNKTVYELTFEFKAKDGQIYQTIATTHQYHKLEDEQLEKLIYDPDMPINAVLLDALPNGLKNYFLTNF